MAKLLIKIQNQLLVWVVQAFKASLKFEVQNQPAKEDEPVIYAFWHRNIIYCGMQRIGDSIVVMISPSKDGDLIADPSAKLGFIPVRGSSSRQGSSALLAMLRWARTNPVAITPDGPKGPMGVIHPGMWQVAIIAKIPVVAVACDAKREWVFNSWDRFRFPKPFTTVRIRYSEPIVLKSKDDIPLAEERFRAYMKENEHLF